MAYDVVSIGDAEMLTQAFQGAAMIFGNGSMSKLIRSGFVLGTLLISIRYLTNQEFPLRYALVGMVTYLVMFVPTDTVTVEDVYTGQVRVVANVPLGVAIPMSIISTMGIKLTTMFETAFSTPAEATMLQHGYLDSLNTLIKLRNIGSGTASSSDALSGDLSKTINAYIENCVMFDLEIPINGSTEVTEQKLQKAEDLWGAMKTSFINRDIIVYLPATPNGSQQNCETAYNTITDYITDVGGDFKAQWDRYMRGVLDVNDQTIAPEDKIDIATQALGITALDSQIYMRNALMASYLKDGPSAFIKRTAQEQLNLQWAGEQTMFNEISRPLMAFVEMFTVAISPIVAFLSTLGPIGMVMMVRYVQMMIWIALWGPTMAVCNLYIAVVTTRIMDALAIQAEDNGSALSAMIMHDKLYQSLETWLSAGGMLASSVPALSLMLVYGGSIAATNLSSKMTSGVSSSIKPGDSLAKEPVSIDSSIKMGSKTEMSPNVGTKQSGMADTTYSASSTFGRASSSAIDSLSSSSATATQALGAMNSTTQTSGQTSSQAQSIMSGITNSVNTGSASSHDTSRTTGSSSKMTASETEAAQAGVNGALNAGLSSGQGISPATIGAAVTASLMSTAGSSASRAKEIGDAAQEVFSRSSFDNNQTSATNGSSNQQTQQSYTGSAESKAKSEQYLSQLSGVEQASNKYSETASLQESGGKSVSMPYQDLGARLDRAGMGPRINQANDEIEMGMSSSERSQRSKDAQYDINNSSASQMVGGSRDALAGFLKLEKSDPVAAAKIINDMVNPGSNGSGVSMSPSEFKGNSRSPNDILDQKTAAGFRSKATGQDDDDGGVDASGNSRNGGNASPQTSSHQDHAGSKAATPSSGGASSTGAPKSGVSTTGAPKSGVSTTGAPKSGASSTGAPKSGATARMVNEALKGQSHGSPDAVAAQIEKGGHVESSSMAGKAGRAFVLEGQNANENIVKPVAQATSGFVSDGKQIASGVVSDAKQLAQKGLDAGKAFDKALGIDSSPSSGNSTKNISNNDLPPVK